MANGRHREGRAGGSAGTRRGSLAADASRSLAGGAAADRDVGNPPVDRFAVDFLTNAPWAATGYGQQAAQLARRLKRRGHPIAIHANYGLSGTTSNWEGIPLFPHGFDGYSNDTAVSTWDHWAKINADRPTVLLTLFDAWVFKNPRFEQIPRVVSWVPIDHAPTPPDVLGWCRRQNVTPVAMSQFGASMLHAAGVECEYAPHGIDTDVFQVGQVSEDGRTGRDLLDLGGDRFLIGMVAANKGILPNRKRFAENLLAVSELMRRHDDVILYMHTEPMGAAGGIHLPTLMTACGVDENRVLWADQWAYHHGILPKTLASLYDAMDVLLACSAGEGFGIPVVEAQACGTPVIVSDFSAQPELVGDGWRVAGQPDWDPSQRSWFFTPFVGEIVDALEQAYNRGVGVKSPKARGHAEAYDADIVFRRHWTPILDRVVDRLKDLEPVP